MPFGMSDICGELPADNEPVRVILDRISDKWSLLVMATLDPGPMRFTAIQRAIPGISQRMLTVTLRSLERDGLVSREAFVETPPRVEYTVTTLGRTLIPAAFELVRWAHANHEELQARRDEFDEARDAEVLGRATLTSGLATSS